MFIFYTHAYGGIFVKTKGCSLWRKPTAVGRKLLSGLHLIHAMNELDYLLLSSEGKLNNIHLWSSLCLSMLTTIFTLLITEIFHILEAMKKGAGYL